MSPSTRSYLQLSPFLLVLLLFVAAPLVFVVVVSVFRYDQFRVIPTFTLENYASVLTSRLTFDLYAQVILLSAITWLGTAVIGFFVAYFLVFHVRNRLLAIGLFLVCTVPFWTSNVIRMISWLPMLGESGVINETLMTLGLIHAPLRFLLFSQFAVVVSYIHLFTIFMIVPVFNSMSRIDKSLLEAAVDAGASRFKTLWLVVLPLTRSGIALGSIFVVTLVMGDFYVVKVMSGGSRASVVSAIYDDVSTLLFPHAAASSVVLMIVITVAIAALMRVVDVRKELVKQG
ncbi:ABC transporter permease [Pararobbsia silviterrae]|uniref:ABC transporter permease n=1 Tax=Pararobbsia silviterrae TaxID=1792498 RepID=A0A494XI32_9BURK|nr:ABC transporter permease [Pararobbsia silviterrae]RKP47829.1 ABC transporter permease [Pararobbsia silviterrae]